MRCARRSGEPGQGSRRNEQGLCAGIAPARTSVFAARQVLGGKAVATITKREIAERIARMTGQPQLVVKEIIQEFFNEILNELVKGNRLEFRDFGVFEVVVRKPRIGRNPRSGKEVVVPAKRAVTFKMGKLMNDRVSAIPPGETPGER